jgi:hypothetical protein
MALRPQRIKADASKSQISSPSPAAFSPTSLEKATFEHKTADNVATNFVY